MAAGVGTERVPRRRGQAVRMWVRLIGLLSGRDQFLLAAASLCMVVAAALKAITPIALGYVISKTLSSTEGSLDAGKLATSMGVIGACVLVQLLLETVRRQLVEVVATAFERDCRINAYGKLLRTDLDDLSSAQNGAIYGRANRSIEGANKLLKLGGMDLLPLLMVSIFALVAAFSQNWRVALVMLGVIPTGFGLVIWQVRNQAGVRVRVRQRKEEIDGRVPEALANLASLRTSGAEAFVLDRIADRCNALRSEEMGHHRAMSLFDAGKSLNEMFWLILTLIAAVYFTGVSPEAVGTFVTFFVLTTNVHAPLRELHRIIDEVSECSLLTGDLVAILDGPDDVGFAPAGADSAANFGEPAFRIEEVSYAHREVDGSTGRGISDLSLRVEQGESVGLVGESGCGKSTLLRVLRRLHHGYTGTIEVNGVDLTDLSHVELCDTIGVVTQEAQLLGGTVADNIRFGYEADDEAVAEAARRASVHDEIVKLPDGYDTLITEGGASLSGGQRQRICIARTLLRNPKILLLDEPTSALDPVNEAAVQEAISSLTGVAVVMVAHRLQTLRSFDRVVVMDAGRIVEQGGYDELASAGGAFAGLLGRGDSAAETASSPVALAAA